MNISAMLTALYTIIRKEMIRVLRIWPQTLIPPVITIMLYFIIFGKVIGGNIKLIDGISYIKYIIPGLIMNAVLINSYANTVSSFFNARLYHSIEEMIVSPMPNWLIITGYVIGGMTRGLLVGVLVVIVAYFFEDINPLHLVFTIIVIICSAILFSSLGFINALLARNYDDTSWVLNFVLTPLIYLGGVFYPITILPEFWQSLSLFNPILYIVNAFRYGILEISSVDPYMALMALLSLNIIVFALALKMMNRGIGIKK